MMLKGNRILLENELYILIALKVKYKDNLIK